MAILFCCEGCGKSYRVENRFGGKTATCKGCGLEMAIPEPPNTVPAGDLREPLAHRPVRKVERSGITTPEAQVRLFLSDGAARLISWLLLIALTAGCFYLSRQSLHARPDLMALPDELAPRLYAYIALTTGWMLLNFVIVTGLVILATALASNWTKWSLPESPFLRGMGTAAVPYLLLFGLVVARRGNDDTGLLVIVIAAPLVLVVGLKELMGLKWSTTAIAAAMLIVLLPAALYANVKASIAFVNEAKVSLAGLDIESIRKWGDAHPEEMKAASAKYQASMEAKWAEAFGSKKNASQSVLPLPAARSTPSLPAPPPPPPDPLAGKIESLLREIEQANASAGTKTKEQLQTAVDALAKQMAPLKPTEQSALWASAEAAMASLQSAVAQAPSETPPAELFKEIENTPLPVPRATPEELSADIFAFKTLKIQPLKTSKIDLKAFADRERLQRWELGDRATIEITVQPVSNPSQQRPWLADRPVIEQIAANQKLLVVTEPGTLETTFGRLNGIGWTRITRGERAGRPDAATYIARLPNVWVIARVATSYRAPEQIALGDKFIQGITPTASALEVLADPYDPTRIVEQFADFRADPAPIIRATGPRGIAALRAYVQKLGDKAPHQARSLLRELAPEQAVAAAMNAPQAPPAANTTVDIPAALIALRSNASSHEKRAIVKRLAAMPPNDQREAVAEALEQILLGRESFFLGEDAADALAAWWRPKTAAMLLPLLDENVFPPSKRAAALKVLPKTGDKKVVYPIARWIIKDPDPVVAALKEMGPLAEDEVIKLLREKDAAVRTNAAKILDTIGTSKCLIELRRASNDPRDAAAAGVARSALETVIARTKQGKATATTSPSAPVAKP